MWKSTAAFLSFPKSEYTSLYLASLSELELEIVLDSATLLVLGQPVRVRVRDSGIG